jgi:hypothetical protein
MNTTTSGKGSWIPLSERRTARTATLVLLLLMLPIVVQAQYTYTTNADNTITITGYFGPGGAVTIPDIINGMLVTSI